MMLKKFVLTGFMLIQVLGGTSQASNETLCAEEMMAMRLAVRGEVQTNGSFREAIPRLDSVLGLALASDTAAWGIIEWKELIRVHILKGYCHERLDEFIEGKAAYEAGLALAERFQILQPDIVYFLYGPLGNIYSRFEETTQADLLIGRCIQLLRDSSAFALAARRTNDLGISLQSRGLLRRGVEVLRDALAFPENSEDTRGRLHQIMTGILLDSFEVAPIPAVLHMAGVHADSSYYWFGKAYKGQPDFDVEIPELMWLKGKLESLRGNWKASEQYFTRAVAIVSHDENVKNRGLAKVLAQFAKMRMRNNQPQEALRLYQNMLHALIPTCPADTVLINPQGAQLYPEYALIDALMGKAQAMCALHDSLDGDPLWMQSAWEACRLAFQVGDSLRALYTYAESKLSLAAESHQCMELALDVLYKMRIAGDSTATDAAIYEVFERNQGLILQAYLKAMANGLVPQDLQQREQRALLEIEEYRARIEGEDDPQLNRAWKEKLRIAGQRLRVVKDSIRLSNPTYYAFRYAPTIVPLDWVQREVLEPGTGMVQYFWGERSVYRLVIGEDGVYFDRLGVVDEFLPYLDFLQAPDTAHAQGRLGRDLHALYQRLWGDRGAGMPFRVAVVPDGPLWQVPFEALLTQQDSKVGYDSPYLIHQHCIHYTFSASIQWWLQQSNMRPKITTGYVGMLPSFETMPTHAIHSSVRPHLEGFVDAYGGQFYRGGEACRKVMMDTREYAGIFHVNSHAQWDNARPYDSFIALEVSNASGVVDSFRLGDIMSMPPKGRLVVLEACQSGIGTIRKGEGMESLAKGFILGGAAAVVSTTRDVYEVESSNLMDRFFAGLGEGQSVDMALRAAKLGYLEDESLESNKVMPWVWGAFRPYGAMGPLPLKPVGGHGLIWVLGGGLMLVLLTVGGFSYSRSKISLMAEFL
jgi:hypothetical protein